jgi:uncharacterized protein
VAIVVSDTSPLRALDHLSHLDLLPTLFNDIIVPPAVEQELTHPRPRFRPLPVRHLPFVRIQAPADDAAVLQLVPALQRGEAEAIVLAQELTADVLIDEAAGRAEATRRGLRVVGVVGLLTRAKQRGLVPAVLPLVEKLRDELGFFVSAKLLDDVRRDAGE